MINRVILVGRLTKDPELRKTNNGTAVASFTIAVDDRTKDANGERTTSFIPCAVWNQAAENVSKYCHKGSLVGVDGRLNQRTYDSKDGKKVSVIEVIADSVQFLETKKQEQPTTQTVETNQAAVNNVANVSDDDLPF